MFLCLDLFWLLNYLFYKNQIYSRVLLILKLVLWKSWQFDGWVKCSQVWKFGIKNIQYAHWFFASFLCPWILWIYQALVMTAKDPKMSIKFAADKRKHVNIKKLSRLEAGKSIRMKQNQTHWFFAHFYDMGCNCPLFWVLKFRRKHQCYWQ